MPNIFHQTIEDILRAATPQQRILWNYIFLRFNERAAVSQFVYEGVPAGSELNVFTARKLYFAYQIMWSQNGGGISAISPAMLFYNENNAQNFILMNNAPAWDATAAAMRYVLNPGSFENIVFSRLDPNGINYVKFYGYRINY
jgi:hypothetical protein